MRIRIDKADQEFSLYIRERDGWTCQRCGNQHPPPGSKLQASHYFGRASESTRFDPANVDALCFACHQLWGGRDREAYRDFKIAQLGEKGFAILRLASNTPKKKDRKMAYIIARALRAELRKHDNNCDATYLLQDDEATPLIEMRCPSCGEQGLSCPHSFVGDNGECEECGEEVLPPI